MISHIPRLVLNRNRDPALKLEFGESNVSPGKTEVKQGKCIVLFPLTKGYFCETYQITKQITNANSIIRIKEFYREYDFGKFPKYYLLIQKVVLRLGIMFSGLCDLCHKTMLEPTEHKLLFCSKTNAFCETLRDRLLHRFGIAFSEPFYLSHQRAK